MWSLLWRCGSWWCQVRRWWKLDIEAPRPQRGGSPKGQENPNTKDRGGDCSMHVRKTMCNAHAICECTSNTKDRDGDCSMHVQKTVLCSCDLQVHCLCSQSVPV
jgi:hypothetical protein